MSKQLLPTDALADKLSEEKRRKPKLYNEVSSELKAEIISKSVGMSAKALKEHTQRVDLSDLAEVQQRTQDYLAACADAGVIPTVMGLAAHGFACSRQWLNEFLRTHPESKSTEFIERVKDAFADVMVTSALNRATDSTLSIFVLKNTNGFADRLEVMPPSPEPPLGRLVDQADLEAKVEADIVEEDF